ncbi:DUF445 domain-containing protein [Larsenimonas suaedae]|uniref:DUF445 domain-containing protein n=1 Tax=Larsenimonas suaedae TaxID=1851019 RepID=A0ABU1GTY0_9GAMM|nr:DUF445 domain-containing protein [Larsenimonas suaedae]MCM2971748.1 DUF445 domain-containing protein [Larsenimonas suaedae]MDR5895300.1 DUF445 domain-containing protein [Larsenimonas suaedae]
MRNHKRLASISLVAALLLYSASIYWGDLFPYMDYLTAFAEAALIGGMADWFAVTALFRHPLGLKIPHTAIIARNKSRIGHSLSTFIRSNFLSKTYVHSSIKQTDIAEHWLNWLRKPHNQHVLASALTRGATFVLRSLDERGARAFFEATLTHYAKRVDLAGLFGRVLGALKADNQHQALLDDTLDRAARWLESPVHQRWLKRQLTQVIFRLINPKLFGREISLNRFAGWLANERIIERLSELLTAVSNDANHPVRQQLDHQLSQFIERTRTDPALIARFDRVREELTDNPHMQRYIQTLWTRLTQSWQADLEKDGDDSASYRMARDFIAHYTRVLSDAPEARRWINDQALILLPDLVDKNSDRIDAYIRRYIDQLSSDDVVEQIEKNVGNDLQYIRINGTLVGGLVGLALHAATQLISSL